MPSIQIDMTTPLSTVFKLDNSAVNIIGNQSTWNQDILKESNLKAQSESVVPFHAHKANLVEDTSEKLRLQIENSVSEAGVLDKLKAMGQSFSKTNDFIAIDKWANKPTFKPDNNWMETVSKAENATQLLDSSGLPASDMEKIAKTKSFEDYTYTVKQLKHEAEINDDINHKIGGGLQATAMIGGALTGLDLPLLFLPYVGEARLARKIGAIEDVYDAIKVGESLAQHKAIMTAANISLSATVSVGQNVIHDDTSLIQSLIGFVSLAGINQYIMNKSFGIMTHKYDNIMSHLSASDELMRINPTLTLANPSRLMLGYNPLIEEPIIMGMRGTGKAPINISPETMKVAWDGQKLLPNILKETSQYWSTTPIEMGMRDVGKGIIYLPNDPRLTKLGAKSDLIAGNLDNIQKEIGATEKSITSLTKLLNNPTLGKDLKALIQTKLTNAQSKLNLLTTGFSKIKKAASFEKAMGEISRIVKANGLEVTHKELANKMLEIIPKNLESLERQLTKEEIINVSKGVVDKSIGEKLSVKTINGKTKAGKVGKDGKFKAFPNQNKVLTALTIAALGSTSASAFSGDGGSKDMGYQDVIIYALLAFLGGSFAMKKVQKAMQSSTGFKNVASSVVKDIATNFVSKEMEMTPEGEKIGKFYSAYNSSLVAMGMPFRAIFYKGTAEGKKLAKDLLWDPENTSTITVEVIKHGNVNKGMQSFYKVYDQVFKEVASEGKKIYEDVVDYVRSSGKIKFNFNTSVTSAIEDKTLNIDPRVRKVAEATRAILVDIGHRAKLAGVKGFRALDDTYFPRITKHANIYQLANLIDGKFSVGSPVYDGLTKNFATMYAPKHPTASSDEINAVAKQFMDSFEDVTNRNISGGVGDILGQPTARAMERIPLDMSKWEDIAVMHNGVPFNIKLEDVFERDVEQVMVSYVNAMEGHIALAEKGYKSFTDALDIAGRQPDTDIQRIATIAINQIIGRQNFDSTTTLAQASKAISNMTMPVMMSMSSVMQIFEAGGTVIRASKNWAHFKLMVDTLVDVLKNRGTDDALMALSMRLDGRGSTIATNKLHTRVFDDNVEHMLANQDSVVNLVNHSAMKARDASMIIYGIAPITDWAQRMNSRMNMDLIARIAFGFKTISKTEMEAYGLTPEFLDMARNVLKVNKKGFLTDESASVVENDPKMYSEMQRVVFNMGQTQMVTPMIGTTPAMFHESALGSASGNLMSFAFNSYATYGANMVKGLSRAEPTAMIDTVMWFATMLVAQELKDNIKGAKKRTDEEKVRMALMQMPLTAPLALPSLLGGSDIQNNTANMLIKHTQTMGNLTEAFRD